MAVDDRQRLQLHRRLEEVLGNDEADTMMAHLPPETWDQVATKDDVHAAALLTRTELRGEMAQLSAELRGEMSQLSAELRGEIHQSAMTQVHWVLGFFAVWSGLMLAAMRVVV